MSNTQHTPQQFKPGDKVRAGKPVDDDFVDSQMYALNGAEGVVEEADTDGSCRVVFSGPESSLPFGSGPWWINNRRLTLVDEKTVEPAAPVPIMARDMTLHDWFAGQALAGIMPSDGRPDGDNNKAQWAFELATAMMERRAK